MRITLWALVAIPFLLILPYVAAATCGLWSFRRAIRIASLTPCPRCGTVVGRAPVIAAKDTYVQQEKERQKQHPGLKLRTVAEWAIRCPQCGNTFYFYPGSNKVQQVSRFMTTTT